MSRNSRVNRIIDLLIVTAVPIVRPYNNNSGAGIAQTSGIQPGVREDILWGMQNKKKIFHVKNIN
jgi:hypothetical protein